jgi:O-antigen/teichoic acid export membrane protein
MCGPFSLAAVVGLLAGGGVWLLMGDRLFAVALGVTIFACLAVYGWWDARRRA